MELCVSLPAGELGSHKEPSQALVKQSLLRADLVKKVRMLWRFSAWFLLPSPFQKFEGLFLQFSR